MVRIPILYFLFMAEALIVFFCLSVYLLLRKKKSGSSVNLASSDGNVIGDLKQYLEEESKHIDKELDDIASLDGNDLDVRVQKEVFATKKNFIKEAMAILKSISKSSTVNWKDIFKRLDKVLNDQVVSLLTENAAFDSTIMDGAAKKSSTLAKSASPSGSGGSKKDQIIELLRYQEMFEELQKEFSKLKATNEQLMNTMEEQATNSEELQQVIMDFEKSNKQLDKFVLAMSREKDNLTNKILNYEQMPSGSSRPSVPSFTSSPSSPKRAEAPSMAVQSGNGDSAELRRQIKVLEADNSNLSNKITELEIQLKHKDDEVKALKINYESLESEYINLYKEHKGETGWASQM